MLIFQLLAEEETKNPWSSYVGIIMLVVLIAFLVFLLIRSGSSSKRDNKEYAEAIEALRPGNKIMTRGGLCGVVVELCDDDTVVIETGSENSGKSYLKIAKDGIYQTDAKGPSQIAREEIEEKRRAEKEARKAQKEQRAQVPPAAPEVPEAPETQQDGAGSEDDPPAED